MHRFPELDNRFILSLVGYAPHPIDPLARRREWRQHGAMSPADQVMTEEAAASVGQRLLWQMEHHRGTNGALNCPLFLRLDLFSPGALPDLARMDAADRRWE
jgi:hypothetical protein